MYLLTTQPDVGRRRSVYALLLEPTGQNADEYRRVGIADISRNYRIYDGWEVQTVTIV
jgi:hypothetical protein